MLAAAPSPAPFRWKAAPTATDKDAIRILEGWAEREITSFACDETERWCRRRIITLNHQVKPDFLALWSAWEKSGVLEALCPVTPRAPAAYITWNGGWVARYKRGMPHDQNPQHVSNHSSGHAFDLMAARYPLGTKPAPSDPIHALVPIANKYGWEWGGKFSRCDPMHWQHHLSPFT